ncbi:MAG TPA: FG-GAP-like repeat-containing protein [Candidatus Acidoferrales bacterium]|nr:FG-GAP-like repeat-containing protein [Candidatus Acidoferrales bacterium]
MSLLGLLSGSLLAQAPAASAPQFSKGQLVQTGAVPPPVVAPNIKPEPKKAREAYKKGLRAEHDGDWQSAHEEYGDAVQWDRSDHDYLLRREVAKSHLVQAKVDLAEREAISGRLKDARKDLLDAMYLDPSNRFVRQRLTELSALAPIDPKNAPKEVELAGPMHLDYASGTRSFDFRGDLQGAYDQVAKQFGVDVAFDVDLRALPVRFKVDNVDFPTAMRLLGDMTDTFWRPLAKHLFFITQNTPQKRKDYAESVVRTVALPASETPEQMTETLRVVRDIAGVTRATLDTNARTITLRASPQTVAVASGLIDDLQKPTGELILEMEVLEVDRDYARNLGITPPQSTQIYALNSQQIQEAQQSVQGLVDVITQVFGQPSSLSGLSSSQITSLLSSGQLSLNSLVPPVVAFGGGDSTFLASMPGAAANFSEMLSLVQHGRRILLRAQDGQPASFFVGDRVPVELSSFSSSLSGTGQSVAGLSATNFPTTNYATGAGPTFVATASLRDNSIDDLITSNFTDNTISVLLGAGDGTFGTQTTFPTGTGPVWITTGIFRTASSNQTIDLAVANQTANTISILLGNGDGTFQAKSDIPAGTAPVSVIAKNLHDLNGSGNLDLIVANHGDNTIYVYTGNGDGTFKAPSIIQLPNGSGPAALATADFNGDGHLDLVVANEGSATISVFLGNGDGTFRARTDYAVGNSPVWVATGDFNGDGVLDLAVANKADNTVSILFGNLNTSSSSSIGNGTFSAQTIYPAGSSPSSIAVADYNIDGLEDLAVAAAGDNSVSVLLNLGGGTFGPNFELPADTDPVSITTADFNGDSKPDVVTANNGSNNVSVILDSSSFSQTSPSAFNGGAFPGVEYLDIGLKVKATPRIHQNGEVTLTLDFDISSLSGTSLNTIPVISNDTVTQTVRVKENETAVLAGVLQHQTSAALNGTPGIAAIPEIGLFASDQNRQNQDQELLIMVTPRMVRLAPRTDHTIYAGQGELEGPGGPAPAGANEAPLPPQAPPQGQPGAPAAAAPAQPSGVPQPTTQVGTPVAPPPQPIQQQSPQAPQAPAQPAPQPAPEQQEQPQPRQQQPQRQQ